MGAESNPLVEFVVQVGRVEWPAVESCIAVELESRNPMLLVVEHAILRIHHAAIHYHAGIYTQHGACEAAISLHCILNAIPNDQLIYF